MACLCRTHHTLEGSVHAKGFDRQWDVKKSVTPETLMVALQDTSSVVQYISSYIRTYVRTVCTSKSTKGVTHCLQHGNQQHKQQYYL